MTKFLAIAVTAFMALTLSCSQEHTTAPNDELATGDNGTGDSDHPSLPDTNTGADDSPVMTDDPTTPDEKPDADSDAWEDQDDDGDGIPNGVETPGGVKVDTDNDDTPDYLDEDSDGDGIPDSVEGSGDADGDGVPNYRDTESDGDNILDATECPDQPCLDTDSDGTPDFLDTDADGDCLDDLYEGVKDPDGDDGPNYLDDDSDGDGILDKDEGCFGGVPLDSDEDGHPNYLDHDSDNDGLSDETEKGAGTDHTLIDTDGDGFDDNTEVAAGSDPLVKDPEFYEGKFYVVLPYQEPEQDDVLKFSTQIKKVDLVITLDLSGSMSYARDNLKTGINTTVVPGVAAAVPDPAFGLSSFAGIEDAAFFLNQPVTKDANAMTTAVENLGGAGGGKVEAQYENLYQIATGTGFNGELLEVSLDFSEWVEDWYEHYADVIIPAVDCTGQLGSIGGACFRPAALPIVMMITDENLYDINDDWVSDGGVLRIRYKWRNSKDQGHYASEVIAAMNAKKAKFIGVVGEGVGDLLFDITEQYEEIADGTGSKGTNGQYFIFQTGYSGNGLSSEIAAAVKELVENIAMDVSTTRASVANPYSIDTTQFIVDIIPSYSDPADSYASKDTTTFYQVKPGINIFFDVTFKNEVFEPTTTENTLFRAHIQVLGEGALLDERDVFIIVPGIKDDGGIES
ncbi:MAG TPA: hypothetical protein P5077_05265 [bacterium]|nr:hypothetical protein [bacterium]